MKLAVVSTTGAAFGKGKSATLVYLRESAEGWLTNLNQ